MAHMNLYTFKSVFLAFLISHRTTESNTPQGYVTSAMDSERGYIE